MCGILFGSSLTGTGEALKDLKHRGPDGTSSFLSGSFFFGHTRLAIIDPDPRSAQPMISASGNSLVIFNGEIYNYKRLKSQLESDGIQFRTTSDTEVVLEGIEKEGSSFIQKLDGMFAIIWFDKTRNKLILARDQAGKNPLYGCSNGNLSLASEIKAVKRLNADKNFEISEIGLQQYTRYGFIPEPTTLWDGIFMFPSGYAADLDLNQSDFTSSSQFGFPLNWNLFQLPLSPVTNEKIKTDHSQSTLKNLVASAIEKRLVADVPVGTFLSGGIDSSLIVGAMCSEFGLKPITASVIFDDPVHSEEDRIKLVLSKWKTEHSFIRLRQEEVKNWIPEALKAYDHPSIDGVNTFIVSKAVRDLGLKVALSGLGGDELFQGYNTFSQARTIQSFPRFVAPAILIAAKLNKKEEWQRLYDALTTPSQFQPMSSIRALYSESSLKSVFGNRYKGWLPVVSPYDEPHFSGLTTDSRLIAQEWFGYMKNMLIRDTNIMSMANSLEVRAPFTDRELLTWILHVPDSMKRPNQTKKQFLTEACQEWLIPEIVNSRKMGFLLPMGHWLNGPLAWLVEEKIGILKQFPATTGLYVLATEQIEIVKQNSEKWPWLWQWVVLGECLSK
ncbi:MAG: asparagine synthase (glutamine-hydrolyzing) [Bacteroidetes bacterium]|nr:asparagine synthase (glutamine-hydrolyzing) [Bacteroidota bacterium]